MKPTARQGVAAMPLFYRSCWHIARVLFRGFYRWQIEGVENVPLTGSVILAANHVSYIDPPLIGAALLRPIYFLARSTLFSNPLMGWLIRTLHALPVDRDGGAGSGLKAVLDLLKQGDGIILFPEGTRSVDGAIQKARAGIGLTVIKSKAPVVPVRLVGVHETWPRHQKLPRPGPIVILFGKPLDFSALSVEAETCDRIRLKAIYQQVSDEIMNAIATLAPSNPWPNS